jgi:hypothetical protein
MLLGYRLGFGLLRSDFFLIGAGLALIALVVIAF